jgi:hypothetical protein
MDYYQLFCSGVLVCFLAPLIIALIIGVSEAISGPSKCPNCKRKLDTGDTEGRIVSEQYLRRINKPGTPPKIQHHSDVYWNPNVRQYQRQYEGRILTIPGVPSYDADVYEISKAECCRNCGHLLGKPYKLTEERNINWHWPRIQSS